MIDVVCFERKPNLPKLTSEAGKKFQCKIFVIFTYIFPIYFPIIPNNGKNLNYSTNLPIHISETRKDFLIP